MVEHRIIIRCVSMNSVAFYACSSTHALAWLVNHRYKIGRHWIEYQDQPADRRRFRSRRGRPRRFAAMRWMERGADE